MRLITIGVSHYCEKARWALERLALPYREERYPPLIHVAACLSAGGGRTAPVLCDQGRAYADSSDILAHLDRRAAPAERLYPSDPVARAEVERLEDRFDEVLGPHVRRYLYGHILGERFADDLLCLDVSPSSNRAYRWGRPLVHGLMRKAMAISPASTERSRNKCWDVFDEVAEILADGRTYLSGGRFSAADLTFAALGAALVTPPRGYGVRLPSLAELPPALAEESRRFQVHPAGEFILRLYAEDRPCSQA
ncbi:MAG: glutathione S-transferase [Planctomycetes bacterium]|nr:glutathione S-transferase [Planctomycetota bacterium]